MIFATDSFFLLFQRIMLKYITREVTEEMNFIDHAISEITNGEDFVQKMADIYEYPEVREELANYPTWIRNIITVIDYDTELAMDGLEFKSYRNVIDALTDIGVTTEAQVLIELESDMSQDGIDSCYSKLALNNDYEAFWDKIYLYADKNMKQ